MEASSKDATLYKETRGHGRVNVKAETEIRMNTLNNKALTPKAQSLRKRMTDEERHLWYDYLKGLPVVVHRQKVIGRYIVDFCIPSAKLVIELDGSQHFTKDGHERDSERDAYIKENGFSILRYANSDVNDHFQDVCEEIDRNL